MEPIRVGLVGAGPWAEKAYAPMLAAGPETALACVWARRPEVAQAFAVRFGSIAVESYEALLERCDAVAFSVPPDVQAELAITAARAGKHLMLDKPLALELEPARQLAAAAEEHGVVSQLMLTHRYRPKVAAFIAEARAFEAIGARLVFVSNAFVRGPYANSWRKEHGALHDLGPHAFDLLEAAVGPIEQIEGHGDPRRWVALTCRHRSSAVSEVALTGVVTLPQSLFRIELYGPAGALEFDAVTAAVDEPWSHARRTFAAAVRDRRSPELDVRHGVRIQDLIDRSLRALNGGS
jgi:predicted dehydrogenase